MDRFFFSFILGDFWFLLRYGIKSLDIGLCARAVVVGIDGCHDATVPVGLRIKSEELEVENDEFWRQSNIRW